VAECDDCRKEASSERMIVSEELQAQLIALEELQAHFSASEELQAKLYLRCLYSLALTVVIPPWRSVGTGLSEVITWVGLGLSVAEPPAL